MPTEPSWTSDVMQPSLEEGRNHDPEAAWADPSNPGIQFSPRSSGLQVPVNAGDSNDFLHSPQSAEEVNELRRRLQALEAYVYSASSSAREVNISSLIQVNRPSKEVTRPVMNGDVEASPISPSTVSLPLPPKSHEVSGSLTSKGGVDMDVDDIECILNDEPMYGEVKSIVKDCKEQYWFKESAWDVSVFVFTKLLNNKTSVFIVMIAVINVAMQVVLCLLINDHFAAQDVTADTVKDLWNWRLTVAHDLQFADTLTRQSLATRVCSGTDGLFMSGVPAGFLMAVEHYLPDGAHTNGDRLWPIILPFFSAQGMVMCIICLVIWWLTLMKEFTHLSQMAEGFWLMGTVSNKEGMPFNCRGNMFQVFGMTRGRKAWVWTILTVRTSLVVVLFVSGSLFLVFTLSLRELLLNCAALEIVINLDELFFTALMPPNASRVIAHLVPLGLRKRRYVKGLDFKALIAFVLLMLLALTVAPVLMSIIYTDKLECARQAVCAGRLDFAIVLDPGGAVAAAGTKPGPADELRDIIGFEQQCYDKYVDPTYKNSYRYRSVVELVRDPAALNKNVEQSLSDFAAPLDTGYLSLRNRELIPIGERITDLNPSCVDFDQGQTVWPRQFLLDMVGDVTNIPVGAFSCHAAKDRCNLDSQAGVRMRQWCPVTCGCHLPNSSVVLVSKETSGCPPPCFRQAQYMNALNYTNVNGTDERRNCTDLDKNHSAFQNYISGLDDVRTSYAGTSWALKFVTWSNDLRQYGCSAHQLGGFGDLCGENVFKLKPLHFLCPATCGCVDADLTLPKGMPQLCPLSCHALII